MFHEIVTHAGGDCQGAASEAHALMLLRRARNQGYAMEATPAGGALIRWTRIELTTGATAVRSIALTPLYAIDDFDEDTRALLDLAGQSDARYEVHHDRRVIAVGDREIPPMDTARLRARRLIAVDDRRHVRLTLPARLGLLADRHVQSGGGTDGFAMCSCGYTVSARTGETADKAQRGHRQAVTAGFVDSISAAYAAAVAHSR